VRIIHVVGIVIEAAKGIGENIWGIHRTESIGCEAACRSGVGAKVWASRAKAKSGVSLAGNHD
jgi:hypothetical protein